jgi:hypothetical protein
MPKNYRKIPKNILDKIEILEWKTLIVWTVLIIKELDIEEWKFENLWIYSKERKVIFENNIIPSLDNWRYSKKNILWYKIKYKDKPKILKNIYYWEKPNFWDWRKWSHSDYRNLEVYDSDIFPPKELWFNIELLKTEKINNDIYYTFKINVLEPLDRNNINFLNSLLFNINLLQENLWLSEVFSIDSTNEEYLETLFIDWDIFPPGERESDLRRIIWNSKNISNKRLKEIQNRYDFINKLKPLKIIIWKSWMREYFWAKFSDNLVVFENKDYWNALYILFDKWEELSKLSRTEIQNRPSDEYIRIFHIWDWEKKAKIIINNKR